MKNKKQNKEDCDSFLKGIGSFIASPINNPNKNNKEQLIANYPENHLHELVKTPNNLLLQDKKSKHALSKNENAYSDFLNNLNNNNKNPYFLTNNKNLSPISKRAEKKDENFDKNLLSENKICRNIRINLDVYPKNELLDKLVNLRLFPKLAEKYSFKSGEMLQQGVKPNFNLKAEKNRRNDYDIFKEIENPEFIDNEIKSPRIRRVRTVGNELTLRSPPVGRFYSKIKKN